ncbi:MAG TPA: hypothetical protein VLM85_16255 [Polyangiaceae bacterium]|nr:hypothetical protein [Polyangiaceae bacterium]
MRAGRVAIVFGLLLTAGCQLPEERQKPKAPVAQCPPEPPVKGMVLATIHQFHLANSGYPFSRIGDALDAFRPDLILVDVGQNTLKGTHPEDAPIDLEYIKYVASTRSTEVVPIGLDSEDPPIAPKADKSDEDALAKEGGSFEATAMNLSFDEANGVEPGQKLLAQLNARTRYIKGNPDWARHEAWLEYATDKALAEKKPKQVLAIVDPIYRPSLEAHLYAMGLGIKNPVKVVAASADKRDESQVPSVVLASWHDNLSALQNRVHRLHAGADRTAMEFHVNVLQLAIDRHGTCCVSLDMVTPGAEGGGGKSGGAKPTPAAPVDERPIDRPKKK